MSRLRKLQLTGGLVLTVLAALYGVRYVKQSPTTPSPAAQAIAIVATTGMIADAVKAVGGSHVQVITLMGPGVDPHAYKCTPKDMQAFKAARLVFYNGLHLEGQMQTFLEALTAHQTHVYAIGQAIEPALLLQDPNFPTGVDPHIWHDPNLWKTVAEFIAQKLSEYDPNHAATYQKNAQTYLQRLTKLHEALKQSLDKIPAQQRVLVTAHDAFGYFGRAYGLQVRALQGISTVAEYGLQDMRTLAHFIVTHRIKAIFIETSVPDRPIRALLEACAQQGHPVELGGALYSDAMGAHDSSAATYEGMLQANVITIVKALCP